MLITARRPGKRPFRKPWAFCQPVVANLRVHRTRRIVISSEVFFHVNLGIVWRYYRAKVVSFKKLLAECVQGRKRDACAYKDSAIMPGDIQYKISERSSIGELKRHTWDRLAV
jgi:hypothetical protein